MAEAFAIVHHVDLSCYERVIAVSDIHGDCAGFDGMLEAVGFGEKDALVIVGDILERGSESLKLLRRIMRLSKTGRVYAVRGNNDVMLLHWCSGKNSDEQVLDYVCSRKHSLIADMARELDMSCENPAQAAALREAIIARYDEELSFLESLPHIIDSESVTFVHAGIKPGDLYAQSSKYCLTAQSFAEQSYCFDRPVVVGHWPASNYSIKVISANIYINRQANIYSIDGGNSMKSWGQINILTFARGGEISCSSYDRLPKVRVLEAQDNGEEPLTLIFPKTLVEVRESLEEQMRCYVPYLGRDMVFDSGKIYEYKRNTYCYDFTTYRLPVKAGEIVAFCGNRKDGILIKQHGIVGKYVGRYERIENGS